MKKAKLSQYSQIAANIGSLLVAIAALWLSFSNEARNSARFEAQLKQSQDIARAGIKPLLGIAESGFIGIKMVSLSNDGLGTAVIKQIYFEKNGVKAVNLADLFSFDRKIIWDNFFVFHDGKFYLRAGENVTLAHLTADSLKGQGFDAASVKKILHQFDEQKKQITINITHEDLLGTAQTPLRITL